jgi:hypothetical protein
VLVVAGYLGLLWWQWVNLPDRVPRHVNAAGQVDAWWSKSAHVWMMLGLGVLVGLGAPAYRLVVSRAGSAAKEWVNVPHPEYWKDDRNFGRLAAGLGRLLDVLNAGALVYLGVVVYTLGAEAVHPGVPGWWYWAGLAGFCTFGGVWIAWLYRVLRVPAPIG